jgi:rubrerythrin
MENNIMSAKGGSLPAGGHGASGGKKYWRCTVCGDLHYGVNAPDPCPTCNNPQSKAVEITKEEFLKLL